MLAGRVMSLGVLGLTMLVGSCGTADLATTDSEALAVAWLEFAAGEQADSLSDGLVTRHEYLSSVTATAECMEEVGYTVGPMLEAARGLRVYFQVNPGSRRDDPSEVWDRCAFDHLFGVEAVYFAQQRYPSHEEAEAELVACLQQHGVDAVQRYTGDFDLVEELEASDASPEAWDCREWFQIVSGEVGVWPPGWRPSP